MTRIMALLGTAAAIGLVAGSWLYIQQRQAGDPLADCRAGVVGGGALGGAFTLVDSAGKTVTDKEVITKPSIVYFGYTFCPDVCPLDNMRNAEAVDILDEKGMDVQPVFISIDPERDTPQVVGEFSANLHPKMIGLTGSLDQVKAASLTYKTYFKKQEDGGEFYLMDHSTFSYLVFPKDGFVEFFRRDDTAQAMADRVACFVDKGAS